MARFSLENVAEAKPANTTKVVARTKQMVVRQTPHQARKGSKDGPFSRLNARKLGLYRPVEISISELFPPFFNGRGIASGDLDGDGFDDLGIATRQGIKLFRNTGTGTFQTMRTHPAVTRYDSFIVAFVDVDNDGDLDVYFTTFGQGKNFILPNNKGRFGGDLIAVPNSNARLSKSTAFADYDLDGDLDLVHGNWFMGFPTPNPPKKAQNFLVRNDRMRFAMIPLPGIPGESLSTLFTDFNMDGAMDLIVGNDFNRPDYFYPGPLANPKRIKPLGSGDGIPHTTRTTMSVDSADFNNDLVLDMYIGQISGTFSSGALKPKDYSAAYCAEIADPDDKARCMTNIKVKAITDYSDISLANVKKCRKYLKSSALAKECMSHIVMAVAIKKKRPELCKKIPKRFETTKLYCDGYFANKQLPKGVPDDSIKQIKNPNVLLLGRRGKGFVDVGQKMNVSVAGWTWNAKFADLDNDTWQDLYVANGTWNSDSIYSNVFFHNQKGKTFKEKAKPFGLDNEQIVGGYTYIDYDNDGDLDLVSLPVNGLIQFYRNNNTTGQAVKFKLVDRKKGNSYGIGAKIFVRYAGGSQVREVKAGGGFHSFDSPVVHFGLGKAKALTNVQVFWPDGEKMELSKKLPAGHTYTIVRR